MFSRLLPFLFGLCLLAGCAKPAPVHPALWLVEGPKGEQAWLFGTIHALPETVDWRSPRIEAALGQADRLLLEVAAIEDDAGTARAFAALAQSPGQPPLEQRVAPDLRDDLAEDLASGGIPPAQLDPYETWAAALMLQQALTASDPSDAANGIDRAVARAWNGPIEEFEGAAAQLAIFDRLPEEAQRAMLNAVLSEGEERVTTLRELEQAWARGDMALIDRLTVKGFAGQPVLLEALLTGRNRAWADRLEAILRAGARPFVAVGAAHLAGKDGL
ncbi:MAG: TraB/GumN family protein, partial [Sphingomonadaceae bacterium]|nr:TraB/GumN family protein [Sphingomonadaceae bacterium]